jgi:lysophospholipase L1-like esterase
MKTILCYGDSNTWGYNPKTQNRHDHNTRWPMALKNLLNKDAPLDEPEWWVVEEGLGGRTSCREDPLEGDKNGLRQLLPILESHRPIDLVAVMLGTNDLKPRFNPSPFDIAQGVQNVALAIQKSNFGPDNAAPKVLMICPPAAVDSPALKHIFGDCAKLSKKLPLFYKALAIECGAAFLDAGKHIKSSPVDGIHLEPEDQLLLAEAVAESEKNLFYPNKLF